MSGKDYLYNVGNNIVMLMINFAIYGISVGFSKLRPSRFQKFFMKLRKDYIWSGIMRMAYMSILDFGLAAFVQIYYFDLSSASIYRYVSTCTAIFTILCILVTFPGIYVFITKNQIKLNDEQFAGRFGCVYEDYRTDGISKYSILVFLARRLIALIGLVFFRFSSYAQSYIFAVSTLVQLGWNILLFPYKVKLDNYLQIGTDALLLFSHMLYCFLLNPNLTEDQLNNYGYAIFLLLMGSNWVLMGGMIAVAIIKFVKFIKERIRLRKLKKLKQSIEDVVKPKNQNYMLNDVNTMSEINLTQTYIQENDVKEELSKL